MLILILDLPEIIIDRDNFGSSGAPLILMSVLSSKLNPYAFPSVVFINCFDKFFNSNFISDIFFDLEI